MEPFSPPVIEEGPDPEEKGPISKDAVKKQIGKVKSARQHPPAKMTCFIRGQKKSTYPPGIQRKYQQT